MVHHCLCRLIDDCRKRPIPARRLTWVLQVSPDEWLAKEGQEIANEIKNLTDTEACHKFCDFWKNNLPNASVVWMKIAATGIGDVALDESIETSIQTLITNNEAPNDVKREILNELHRHSSQKAFLDKLLLEPHISRLLQPAVNSAESAAIALLPSYVGLKTVSSYFARPGLEKDFTKVFLLLHGGGGHGKTTFVVRFLRENGQLLRERGFNAVLFFNVFSMSTKPSFDEAAFYLMIAKAVKSCQCCSSDGLTIPNHSDITFDWIENVLNGHAHQFLLVLDDLYNPYMLRCVANLGASVRCIATSRSLNVTRASINQLPTEIIKVNRMLTTEVRKLFEGIPVPNSRNLNLVHVLEERQLQQLAERCNGIPYAVNIVAAMFQNCENEKEIVAICNLLSKNPRKRICSEQVDGKESPYVSFSTLLSCILKLRTPTFVSRLYYVLLFPIGEPIRSIELALLWDCDDNEAIKQCTDFVGDCLFERAEDKCSYVIHELLSHAVLEHRNESRQEKDLSSLQSKLVDEALLKSEGRILMSAVQEKQSRLLMLITTYTEGKEAIANAVTERSCDKGESLLQALFSESIKSFEANSLYLDIFCRLTQLTIDSVGINKTRTALEDKYHGSVFQQYPWQESQAFYTALLHFVCKYNFYGVLELLLSDYDKALLECSDDVGTNALMIACQSGHCEIVKVLLGSGAFNLDHDNINGETALSVASKTDIAKQLVEAGANINFRDKGGSSILTVAARHGRAELVKLLLDNHADVQGVDNTLQTALMASAIHGEDECTDLLIQHGATVTEEEFAHVISQAEIMKAGRTKQIFTKHKENICRPMVALDNELCEASRKGNLAVVCDLLMSSAYSPDSSDNMNFTALFWACRCGHVPVAESLIQSGADVNKRCRYGFTPLLVACMYGQEGIARLLLDHSDINIELTDDAGHTALINACCYGRSKVIVELLLQKEANIDARLSYGHSSICLASRYGHKEILEILIGKKPNLEFTIKSTGTTALLAANSNDDADIVNLLIDAGANLEAVDRNGRSLIRACQENRLSVAKVLLNKMLKLLNMPDRSGEFPIFVAAKQGNAEMFRLLLEYGAEVGNKTSEGNTPLMAACEMGHIKVTEQLLINGARLEQRNHTGNTALMVALENKQTKLAEVLIYKGANTLAKNFSGKTCADIAGSEEIRKKLLLSC